MGLNNHLRASHFAGLIDNVSGASKYLKAPTSLAEVTHTLDCCVQSRMEYLDVAKLTTLGVPQFPNLQDGNRMSEATHVVVGITYGASAYCVLTQEVDKTDMEAVKEIEEALLNIAGEKMCVWVGGWVGGGRGGGLGGGGGRKREGRRAGKGVAGKVRVVCECARARAGSRARMRSTLSQVRPEPGVLTSSTTCRRGGWATRERQGGRR